MACDTSATLPLVGSRCCDAHAAECRGDAADGRREGVARERTMTDIMRGELGAPKIVDRTTFQADLDALRVREKAHTREGDAIAAARRRLPMVEVDGATPLMGERGTVTLWDAFEGR